MAPKVKGNRIDLKQEDVLQAVVIADSFNHRFSPITEKRPRALLPVANVPILDYTLEFLCSAGVQEIFVFCCHLGDQIRAYIQNSRWNNSSCPCSVSVILLMESMSMGDVLREIDGRSLVKSDFILVSGDIIANLKLDKILLEHKRRKEKDKSFIMTMVMKEAPPGHSSRCKEDDVVVAVEKETNRILHFQKVSHEKQLDFPKDVFTDHKEVTVRYDLLDCRVSICSPIVPQMFKDNFDYLTRDDFVRGILINDKEVMVNTIHVSVVTDEYAARISNLQMYDAVSRDVICRWTYPLVPENCNNDSESILYGRHNVYLSKDVTLARGCMVEENVVIGSGTCLGSNTFISRSVIGKACKIGKNVKIIGAYLWDGVTIEDNCVVEMCVLCSNVTVYEGVTIQPGCVLSWDVSVGPNVVIPKRTLLTSHEVKDEDFDDSFSEDDEEPKVMTEDVATAEYGTGSKAFVYRGVLDSDEDEDLVQDMWGMTVQSDEEEDDLSSIASEPSDDMSPTDSPPPDDVKLFCSEMMATMTRAVEENHSTDNLILEINSLKLAFDIGFRELNMLLMKGLLELPFRNQHPNDAAQIISVLQPHLKKNLPLLKNYMKSAESQLDCLLAMEEYCILNDIFKSALMKVIHMLYEWEVLAEQVILKWYEADPEKAEDIQEHHAIRKQVSRLIQWLQSAEEESSEDDS